MSPQVRYMVGAVFPWHSVTDEEGPSDGFICVFDTIEDAEAFRDASIPDAVIWRLGPASTSRNDEPWRDSVPDWRAN